MNRTTVIMGLALFASLLLPQLASGGEPLKFYDDLASAQADNEDNEAMKPYVLYFGATWCGPCKRMKSVTFEALNGTGAASEYQWLKYDIDKSPEVAARFGLMGVPAIVVLDAEQNPVGASAGFMTAGQLIKFIETSLADPQTLPPTVKKLEKMLVEASDATELAESVQLILTELTDRERADRDGILKLLAAQPAETQRVVLESLELEPLARRAAATQALTAYMGKPINFDPFESAEKRAQQLEELKIEITLDE